MVFCGLPLLTLARGHLTVDLFDKWLLRPGMGVVAPAGFPAGGAGAAADRLRVLQLGHRGQPDQEISQSLSIPRAGMYAFIAFASLLSVLAALLGCFGAQPSHPHATEEHAK